MMAVPSCGAPATAAAAPSSRPATLLMPGILLRLLAAAEMAAGDVAGLVGDRHRPARPGSLVRRIRPVLRNRFCPPATNAFSFSSFRM